MVTENGSHGSDSIERTDRTSDRAGSAGAEAAGRAGASPRSLAARVSGVTSRRNVLRAAGTVAAAGVAGISLTGTAAAQNQPSIEWERRYRTGDQYSYGYSHAPAHDRGYVFCGYRYYPGDNRADYALYKTDTRGNVDWNRHYDNRYYDHAYDVVPTHDGGYACCGYSYGRDNPNYSDYWMVKTDDRGRVDWRKEYSSGDQTEDRAYGMYHTDDDGFVLGGYSDSHGGGGSKDYWAVKTDDRGNVDWRYKYDYRDDECWAVKSAHDDGFVLGGYSSGRNQYDNYDYRLTKIDGGGNEQWSRQYGYGYNSRCYDVVPTGDGGYLMGGYTYHPNRRGYAYYAVKTNGRGRHQWDQTYYLPNYDSYCYSLKPHDDGYVLHGYAQRGRNRSDYLTVKVGEGGSPQWYDRHGYGYNDVGWDVYTYDDYFTTCGYTSDRQGRYYSYMAEYAY